MEGTGVTKIIVPVYYNCVGHLKMSIIQKNIRNGYVCTDNHHILTMYGVQIQI